MQILCIGDVVGSHGCDFLRRTLPAFMQRLSPSAKFSTVRTPLQVFH